MLTLPDFNRLKTFYFVHSKRSILGAAQALHVTRSAVSQSLKALEDEMGESLFFRNSKQFKPTPAGDVLFRVVESFMTGLTSTMSNLDENRKEAVGLLKIGAPLDFGSRFLTDAIGQFHRRYPRVTFELCLAIPKRQLDLLNEGKLDLAFIDNGDVFEKQYPISTETVWKENFVLAAGKTYYKEHVNGDHSFSHLKALSFIDYLVHAPVTRMWFKHHFGKAPQSLRVVYSAESVHAVRSALKQGLGLAVIPEHLVQEEFKTKQIVKLTVNKKDLINPIMLATALDRQPRFVDTAFRDFFVGYAKSQATFGGKE